MKQIERLRELTLKPVDIVESIDDIPKGKYMVYVLMANKVPIIVGHGKFNRAKVICDSKNGITNGHIKAIKVRLYHLYGDYKFRRYIIPCTSKLEAYEIEKELHSEIGGNETRIPEEIKKRLLERVEGDEKATLLLEIAIQSSFDGLYDLRRWRRKGIIGNETWKLISKALEI